MMPHQQNATICGRRRIYYLNVKNVAVKKGGGETNHISSCRPNVWMDGQAFCKVYVQISMPSGRRDPKMPSLPATTVVKNCQRAIRFATRNCGRKSLSSQSSIGNSLRAVANVGFIWIICNMTSRQLWAP